MGNCVDNKESEKKGNLKEKWEFSGEIASKNKNIIYYDLKGTILITEVNNIKEIEVSGKIKNKNKKKQKQKQFMIKGEESPNNNSKKDPKTTTFLIRGENGAYPKEVLLIKEVENNAKLEGEYEEKEYGQCKLSLLLKYIKKKENTTLNGNTKSELQLTEEFTEKDIISNSTFGLKNLGNTCYINSSLQILIHIPQFVELIKSCSDFEENIIESINLILEEIINLEKKNKNNYSINPKKFLNIFLKNHYSDYYNNYSQLDSEIFLEDLLWDINEELLQLTPIELAQSESNAKKEKEYFKYLIESQEDIYFKMKDLFYVTFIHEKKCESCDYITYYFDDSPGLKLNFEKINHYNRIDLMTLINENFKKPIKIKSSVPCEKCQESHVIIETTRIAKLPKILILSLQKTNKNNTRIFPWVVKYDKEFGIKEIVDQDLSKDDYAIYQLFAINNHYGNSPISGHYWSNIFLEKYNKWYSFDDQIVNEENKLSPSLTNYILFYKQKHN